MRENVTVIECEECQFYREEDGYSWCSYWSLDEGDCQVRPDGYCSEALERENRDDR